MKRITYVICSLFIILTLTNCKSNSESKTSITPTLSVSDLMKKPIFEKTINVSGVISELGIRNSTSFKLSSGGKSINVWYDMMVNNKSESQPSVDISGLKNKTLVILTGKLKEKGNHVQKNDFWISSIKIK